MDRKIKITPLLAFFVFTFMLFVKATTAQEPVVLPDRNAMANTPTDKTALLIGNAAYKGQNELETPINDVARIETALKNLKFHVVRVDNGSQNQIYRAFSVFGEKSKQAKIALFYYSGHMVQFNERNYLIPIDAKFKNEKSLIAQSVALDSIINNLKAAENVISIDLGYLSHFKNDKSKINDEISFSEPKNFKNGFLSYITGSNASIKKGKSSLFSTYFSEEIIISGYPYTAYLSARTKIKSISDGKQDLVALGSICTPGYGSCINWKYDTIISASAGDEKFPWPPPKASARDEIPIDFFSKCETLGDVNLILKSALDKAEYFDKSYFLIENNEHGFVVVTRLEQINKNATSIQGRNRWALKASENNSNSISKYLRSLFFPQKGYFRVIAFIVTNKPIKSSSESATRDEALGWLHMGMPSLPHDVAEIIFNEDYKITALIYEYELPENDIMAKLSKNPHQGREHLIKANLWNELSKN